MRVVLDTNTIVSALIWGGTPGRVYTAALAEGNVLLGTQTLLDELQDVIFRAKLAPALAKFNKNAPDLYARHLSAMELIQPAPVPLDAVRDPQDLPILACALGGNANYIVSGDKDLTDLKIFEGISIISAAAFLAILNENANGSGKAT